MTGVRYNDAPLSTSTTDNWVARLGGLPPYLRALARGIERSGHTESEALAIAVGRCKVWAAGGGNVTAKTRAKAAAAVAAWEALKAASHARDALLESSSAGLLLPKGPIGSHLAQGNPCKDCGLAPSALPHMAAVKARRARIRVRHAGQRAAHPADKHRVEQVRSIDAHAATVETQAAKAMQRLFDRQQTAVVSRLQGARGRRAIRTAPQPDDEQPAAPVDAGQVFDTGFWADQTAQTLGGVYDTAQSLTVSRLADALHPGETIPDAVQSVEQVLAARAQSAGTQITQTTYAAIAAQLAEGLQAGEPMGQLVKRVQTVFQDADQVRAEQIARTESIGALNQAAQSYAQALPSNLVAYKEWAATEDSRTRPAHRAADGQQVNVDQPFLVGGTPMMQPGDPTAPPDEVIQCRCRTIYVPRRLAAVPAA